MKGNVRFLGLDDGPFRKGDASVPLVGVVTQGPSYVEGVLTARVAVDGDDATEVVRRLVSGSRFRPLLRAVFLNGIFVGGFNLVDPDVLHEATKLPIIALVRTKPRAERVERALGAAFPDGAERWARVRELEPESLPGLRLWSTYRGVTLREAASIVKAATVRGRIPEPLRLAHVIASGLVRGESRGKS